MRDIQFVSYSGEWPALCCGTLILKVNGVEHEFNGRLGSGGSAWFDGNWYEHVEEGPWDVFFYDDFFSEEKKQHIRDLVNDNVEWSCCGGCL